MTYSPVCNIYPALSAALRHAPQVLLQAPTGSGKSTVLPLLMLDDASVTGRIIMLEPRRIAARSVAHRLASQRGEKVGETVGYRMRGETRVSKTTQIEVVTEGILVRMLQQDPELSDVDIIILDEFHERSLQADLALALLLDVQSSLRPDLRLLIMSATLNNEQLLSLLPDAEVITAEGRAFPVERRWQPLNPHQPFISEVARHVLQLYQQESGSVLVFLPGQAEICRLQEQLAGKTDADTLICPLYGALSLDEQQQAIEPPPEGMRKIVLATNIAETSLTIEGVTLVVDSCQEKVTQFDPRSGLTRLVRSRISRAAMTQRAGRAGRLSPGICLHLCGQAEAERAAAHSEPEICHTDLSGLMLNLAQWGCREVSQLSWLDTPPAVAVRVAQKLLTDMGCLLPQGGLTAKGEAMAGSGTEPRLAALWLYTLNESPQQIYWAARLIAVLEEPPREGNGNLLHDLTHPSARWDKRAQQLLSAAGLPVRKPAQPPDNDWLCRTLLQGFPDRIAGNRGRFGIFQLANGVGAVTDESSPLGNENGLVAPLILQNEQYANARILRAVPFELSQLQDLAPHLLKTENRLTRDESRGTWQAWRAVTCGQLIIERRQLAAPSADIVREALLGWIGEQGLSVLTWRDESQQLLIRLQLAKIWFPEKTLPAGDDETLRETLAVWLSPYLNNVRNQQQLAGIDLYGALRQRLDWSQQQWLDTQFPRYFDVPTGSRIPVEYTLDKPPVMAVRIQEMYGVGETPSVAQGRLPVTVSLLSPAHRPIQVTADLKAFWAGSYREVQKEMKGRYPKHFWPDDPANAQPTKRVKKFM
ncbi:ATP-dependent helicase HrpB [Morganella psychrotolerans]|uniref:ATP-dependent helicase HrpB n=1 Tax=Morganella psychrotolerans TaxID=368603 RepID=UPI0039B0D3D8